MRSAVARSTETIWLTPRSAIVTPKSRSIRAMVIGLWVIRMKRVDVEQVAVALDIGVVERRVDLVEHADRRRVGQEYREDQRGRRQRLLAARKQGHHLRLLARRAGEDLQPCIERVFRIDQLELGRAAAEQHRKEPLELAVDDLEGGEQALAALPVEGADRLAQPAHSLAEIVALGGQPLALAPDLGQFVLGPQIDGTEALRTEALHFLQCVEKGERPQTDGEAGLQVVSILEAATRSLQERGRPVDLK